MSQTPGQRKNQHIVDSTHILAHRSFVAGFLEGNTSSSRPWVRIGTKDGQRDDSEQNKFWLQHFTERVHAQLANSNFYQAAGSFYADYGVVNTGAYYFEVLEQGGFHVHSLVPGSYYVLDDAFGRANILIREFSLNVKALVELYGGRKQNGKADWSNISPTVRKMYEDGNYSAMVDVVHVIMQNPDFDAKFAEVPTNRQWLELTYELGAGGGTFQYTEETEYGSTSPDPGNADVFLKRFTGKRKPFVVGKSTEGFEYGEKGPSSDSMGLIKSLNKKAIGKDMALEQILTPTLQGPAALKKSYITNAPNSYIPLDAKSIGGKQKVESVFQVSPAIGAIIQDVDDLRGMVDKLYYADFLLYLSKNPKTRTAAETNAIIEEQQRIIGPNLQSLHWTHNIPVLEWVMDYTLYEDEYLDAPPPDLEGQGLKPELISVFAQAQKAADMPSITQYIQTMMGVAQLQPKVWDKINIDKFADLLEDRLFLPAGLNNPQSKVDAIRQQAQADMQRQQAMQETLPAVAGAAKDMAMANRQQQ